MLRIREIRSLLCACLGIGLLSLMGCGGAAESPPTATALPETPTQEPTITPEPTIVPTGLWVDPTQALGEINPLVYGTNYGPWMAVTLDTMELFENSGLTYLRFPGGRWGDSNNLRDYQVRQLMTHAEQLDGEVTISARMLGGTPEQAADLVRMTNDEMGYDVQYWSIGNEPSLYAPLQKAEEWDTAYYNEQWRLFAEAMLEADPSITLMGPNTHQFQANEANNPKDENGLDWMREFLRTNGDMIEVVTFHRYPFPANLTEPYPPLEALRNNSAEWDEILPKLREVILEETGREIPIGVMEVNSNWSDAAGGETSPDSHISAIWWGDSLTRMIKQDVEMVTHFALANQSSGWALMNRTTPRPAYYVYQLYKQMGETKVAVGNDQRYVNILGATRAEDGALTVLLLNLADDPATVPFAIEGETDIEVAERWLFDPEHNAVNLGSDVLDGMVELPGLSMTLLVIEDEG